MSNAIKTRLAHGLFYCEVTTAKGVKTTGRYLLRADAEKAGQQLEQHCPVSSASDSVGDLAAIMELQ